MQPIERIIQKSVTLLISLLISTIIIAQPTPQGMAELAPTQINPTQLTRLSLIHI